MARSKDSGARSKDSGNLERDQTMDQIKRIWSEIKGLERDQYILGRDQRTGARSKDDRMVKSRRQEMCRNSCKQNLIIMQIPPKFRRQEFSYIL